MNRLAGFAHFALTREEMKRLKGGTNYDCTCSNKSGQVTGGYGFSANSNKEFFAKNKKLAQTAWGCKGSQVTCGAV